ncbi:hypothetical protein DEU56DRAFT_173770 [Suillus clintonianus]|uniref:uncharacterized protein n=1 Tax=Suillus clintonianus TaxID=1904413 RepID=UPI001B87B5C9|nr:uncharacterized protein DEU56DRAFT_173770 [Suillus clintonianus]KAG2116175.1 hypothetical protein DEU56DRAFT_173770 [Suillus clintonianus]
MLHELPTEIALYIASYLPLQSLRNVSLVSREWHGLITDNVQAVYRNAAILHRFVLLVDLQADSSGQKPDRKKRDWSQFCQRRLQIERGWRGKAPSVARELNATGKFVHRMKVDEKEKFVITTRHTGGLSVTDYNTDRVLWATTHVDDYAHCEYDHGYIIFNRHDNNKEVWRYARDFRDSEMPEDFKPDESMFKASQEAAQRFASPTNRGHFRPWALLQMPEVTRAFRLSYPTLLSAGANNAYLWDVPTSRLVETIGNIQAPNQGGTLGRLNYVEVNDQYAFFCGSIQLRVFARGGGALVYHLGMKDLPCTYWDVLPDSDDVPCASSLFQPQLLHEAYHVSSTCQSNFVAAHVSSSGKDIGVLTASGIFIWMPGFERLIHREATLNDTAILLNFNHSLDNVRDISVYLALGESNEKAAIATRKGLFIVSLDPEISKLTAEAPPRPGLSVCRIAKYDHSRHLSFISCLQMTHTGLFFNWYPSSEQNRPSQPARRMVMIPPQPQQANQIHVPVQLVPAQGVEGQSDFLPGLEPIESSDDDELGEGAVSDPPSPTIAEQAGPPSLVETHEEDEDEGNDGEGGDLVVDEDVDDFEMEEVEDEMIDDFQFGGDGFMQVIVNDWFLPINSSMVHCIHV